LAASYFHLRTGRLPFANNPTTFAGCYHRPEPDLALLPAEERAIIARGLASVPFSRWSSCSEMMDRLTACAAPTMMASLTMNRHPLLPLPQTGVTSQWQQQRAASETLPRHEAAEGRDRFLCEPHY